MSDVLQGNSTSAPAKNTLVTSTRDCPSTIYWSARLRVAINLGRMNNNSDLQVGDWRASSPWDCTNHHQHNKTCLINDNCWARHSKYQTVPTHQDVGSAGNALLCRWSKVPRIKRIMQSSLFSTWACKNLWHLCIASFINDNPQLGFVKVHQWFVLFWILISHVTMCGPSAVHVIKH